MGQSLISLLGVEENLMKQKVRLLVQAGIVLLVAVAAASAVLAQNQVHMKLTNPGDNVLAGIYVGPYYATIDGVPNVPIICDDFSDETYVDESWNANVTTVASNSPTWISQRDKLDETQQSTDYAEVAYLAEQLMNPATTCKNLNADCAGDIQFAIWNIFDPGAPLDLLKSSGLTNDLANARAWLNAASMNAGLSSQYSNVLVYSPQSGSSPPQEFIMVQTPEPGFASLLGVDLVTLAGVVLFVRHRIKKRASPSA